MLNVFKKSIKKLTSCLSLRPQQRTNPKHFSDLVKIQQKF